MAGILTICDCVPSAKILRQPYAPLKPRRCPVSFQCFSIRLFLACKFTA